MTKVLHLRPPPEPAELRNEIEKLRTFVDEVVPTLIEIAKRVDALPPPRFEFPPGWVSVKWASAISGFKPSTIYAWTRCGKVVSAKDGRSVRVDPGSLPRRIK